MGAHLNVYAYSHMSNQASTQRNTRAFTETHTHIYIIKKLYIPEYDIDDYISSCAKFLIEDVFHLESLNNCISFSRRIYCRIQSDKSYTGWISISVLVLRMITTYILSALFNIIVIMIFR